MLFHGRPNGLAFFLRKPAVPVGIEEFQNGLAFSLFHLLPLLRVRPALSLLIVPELRGWSIMLELRSACARFLLAAAVSRRPELRVSTHGATLPLPLELVRSLTALLLPLELAA